MHQGIPVVTTDIGAEGLEDVGNFIGIGNTAEEIVERVVSLYMRKGSLKENMEAERAYIMEHFSKNRMKAIVIRLRLVNIKWIPQVGSVSRIENTNCAISQTNGIEAAFIV